MFLLLTLLIQNLHFAVNSHGATETSQQTFLLLKSNGFLGWKFEKFSHFPNKKSPKTKVFTEIYCYRLFRWIWPSPFHFRTPQWHRDECCRLPWLKRNGRKGSPTPPPAPCAKFKRCGISSSIKHACQNMLALAPSKEKELSSYLSNYKSPHILSLTLWILSTRSNVLSDISLGKLAKVILRHTKQLLIPLTIWAWISHT